MQFFDLWHPCHLADSRETKLNQRLKKSFRNSRTKAPEQTFGKSFFMQDVIYLEFLLTNKEIKSKPQKWNQQP